MKHFCRTCGMLWPVIVDSELKLDIENNKS